ncbi:hypothetical protein SCUCBS95973_006200 [Sporothrix curviconia]|uniref:Zn(2)-C6 fungal-type domain-containing protein n=1 Tax=Sporothrix curviconia TaxID=1260050 RepID=A0ABP0C441_9PEZI
MDSSVPLSSRQPQTLHPQQRRPKRSQVVRACDWCRQHRSKCDNSVPCANCRSRGARCSNDDMAAQHLSLPGAHREIERLRRHIAQLEQKVRELKSEEGKRNDKTARTPKTPGTASEPSPFSDLSGPPGRPVPSDAQGGAARSVTDTGMGITRPFWGGVHVSTARSPHKTWYGPSSLFYFIGRMAEFLEASLQLHYTEADTAPCIDNMLDVNPAGMLVDGPAPARASRSSVDNSAYSASGLSARQNPPLDLLAGARFLTLTQEEYFLDLYWPSYHTSLCAIVDEAAFRQHYRSLWRGASGQTRAASALVDIVLALCMQLGVSTMAPGMRQKLIVDNDDTTVAGRWYYRRCQALLEYELESPSLATLQCHILCGVYLCNGTFQNMSDSACGLAVRAAHMLGIHLEPPASLPLAQRELRKRIWWALYVLDSKIGMKLGRPFQVHLAGATTPSLLSDGVDVAAAASGSNFAPLGDDRTWLSFHVFHSRLFCIARSAHVAFYCSNAVPLASGQATIWDDPAALEAHAWIALAHGQAFAEWAASVPPALTTPRAGGSPAFATDGSALEIEPFSPLWVQRQRVLLEVMYHNLSVNLYRPMICFRGGFPTEHAQQCAAACARHAIALTQITHQVLSSTAILAGWHEAFQWQWNAAMTLVGFLLASANAGLHSNSNSADVPDVPNARRAVDQAVAVFDLFGHNFAVATSAAKVIRNLCTKVDFLLQNAQTVRAHHLSDVSGAIGACAPWGGSNGPAATGMADRADLGMGKPTTTTTNMPLAASTAAVGMGSMGMAFAELDPAVLQDTMLMAFDVDQWLDLNELWPRADGLEVST